MQLWKKLISLFCGILLAGCARVPVAQLGVRSAGVQDGWLSARLDWRPTPVVLDALDHGIALDFEISLQAQQAPQLGWHATIARLSRHVQLRYFPLSLRYTLRDLDRNESRSFAARSLLIAALEDLRIELPADWPRTGAQRYVLKVALDSAALPGALRLPAWLDSAWQLSTGDFTWSASVAG